MTIINTAWVDALVGTHSTAAVTGVVKRVTEAPDGVGVLVHIENDDTGESVAHYVVLPLTPEQLAERADADAKAAAEQEAAQEALLAQERVDLDERRRRDAEAEAARKHQEQANLAQALGHALEVAGIPADKVDAAKAALVADLADLNG